MKPIPTLNYQSIIVFIMYYISNIFKMQACITPIIWEKTEQKSVKQVKNLNLNQY